MARLPFDGCPISPKPPSFVLEDLTMRAQNLDDKRPTRVIWLIFLLLAAGIVLAGFFNYRYRVRLLDSRGVVRLSVPATEEPLTPAIKGKVAETLQSGQITFVDFYQQEHSRKISLAFLVPIPDDQDGGRPLGVFP